MKYKTTFTVVTSGKTGKILYETWEPVRRLFWPLPWMKLPGSPTFSSYVELMDWFENEYPGEKIEYSKYGKSRRKD